jgi:putative acetyltransferase
VTLTLRRMRPGEEARLYEVLRSAVLRGTTRHYDEAQRRAWAPDRPLEGWVERLGTAQCFVAVVDGLVVGFLSVTPAGHVDLAYVLPERHGAGIGHQLLARAEQEMRLTGVERMTTEASLAAEGFFARQGWVAGNQETVLRNGLKLRRVRMHKVL